MTLRDDLGRAFAWHGPPRRIVSLCPSQTELLYALGLADRVLGRTRFCIHPAPAVRRAARVGGTKDVSLSRIRALRPDFILAEQEEQNRETVELLSREFPVCVTRVENVDDALQMILNVGVCTVTEPAARVWHERIAGAFDRLPTAPPLRVAYLIWKDPWMAAGQGTYIQSVLERLGLVNVFLERDERYPTFDLEELAALNPELLLLSSEPYPFGEKHAAELTALLPTAHIRLVDGEWFSWYGVRMWAAAEALAGIVRDLRKL